MFESEYQKFQEQMTELCTAFDKPTTDARVKVFWRILKTYPFDVIKGRIRYWMATKEKFPTPAQLAPQDDTPIDDSERGPHPNLDLVNWIVKNKKLTKEQMAIPWTHIVRLFDAPRMDGKIGKNHGAEFRGITIPAAGGADELTVMREEMNLHNH